ncbi:MAG: DUF1127 domain-containing protein [Acidiferrobacterales bacterium]
MNTTHTTTVVSFDERALLDRVFNLARRALDTLLTWQEREMQRRHLMELDNRLLADMGMSRADAAGEYNKPFWRP